MVRAKALRTLVDPAVHRMVLVLPMMQTVPAVRQIRLDLPMKENQRAGERRVEPSRRAKYKSTVEFLLSLFFLTPLR